MCQASVNVDAELVRRGGMLQKDEKLIELSNGCICCTLREDLLTALSLLAAENRYDHVLIESSGISEPLPGHSRAPKSTPEVHFFHPKRNAAMTR